MQRGLQIMKKRVTSKSTKIAVEQAKIDALLKRLDIQARVVRSVEY